MPFPLLLNSNIPSAVILPVSLHCVRCSLLAVERLPILHFAFCFIFTCRSLSATLSCFDNRYQDRICPRFFFVFFTFMDYGRLAYNFLFYLLQF